MKITIEEFLEFHKKYFDSEFTRPYPQRYGQHFCNIFNITDEYLFYEEETLKVQNLILQHYVREA